MAQAANQLDRALYQYYTSLWAVFQVPPNLRNSRECTDRVSCRWRKSGDDVWSCALHGRILCLRQDPTHLHYRALFPLPVGAPPTPPSSEPQSRVESSVVDDDTDALVHYYFNLSPNLTELYEQWSLADLNFKKRAPKFTGVRILKQDAWEALVGFICSSNNNIARISQMVRSLYVAILGALLIRCFGRWRNCAYITDH